MQRKGEGPGVVSVFAPSADQLAQQELRCLRRPYIKGLTLRERREAGPCSLQETASILTPLMSTLARLHAPEAGSIIHRDLTPGNIIVDEHGRPWLNDFGLARDESSPPLQADESLQGTRRYLPPELLAGEQPTSASDIYQSALLASFLLSETPSAFPLELEARHDWATRTLNPLGLAACLAPEPKKRPPAKQVADIWERFLA